MCGELALRESLTRFFFGRRRGEADELKVGKLITQMGNQKKVRKRFEASKVVAMREVLVKLSVDSLKLISNCC